MECKRAQSKAGDHKSTYAAATKFTANMILGQSNGSADMDRTLMSSENEGNSLSLTHSIHRAFLRSHRSAPVYRKIGPSALSPLRPLKGLKNTFAGAGKANVAVAERLFLLLNPASCYIVESLRQKLYVVFA